MPRLLQSSLEDRAGAGPPEGREVRAGVGPDFLGLRSPLIGPVGPVGGESQISAQLLDHFAQGAVLQLVVGGVPLAEMDGAGYATRNGLIIRERWPYRYVAVSNAPQCVSEPPSGRQERFLRNNALRISADTNGTRQS